MFIIFSKEKIKAYLVSLATVGILFVMPFVIKNDKSIETSTNIVEQNEIQNINNEIIE